MLWIIILYLALAKGVAGQGTNNLSLVLSELPQLSNLTSYLSLFPDLMSTLENGNFTSNCPQRTHSIHSNIYSPQS